jgi:hypothetical protein
MNEPSSYLLLEEAGLGGHHEVALLDDGPECPECGGDREYVRIESLSAPTGWSIVNEGYACAPCRVFSIIGLEVAPVPEEM